MDLTQGDDFLTIESRTACLRNLRAEAKVFDGVAPLHYAFRPSAAVQLEEDERGRKGSQVFRGGQLV